MQWFALMDQSNKGSLKLDISDNDFSYAILGGINQRKDGDVAQGSMGELQDANVMKDHSFVADAYWYSADNYGTAFYAPKEAGKIAVWHADPFRNPTLRINSRRLLRIMALQASLSSSMPRPGDLHSGEKCPGDRGLCGCRRFKDLQAGAWK